MEAAFTEQESDFPLQFPAPSFPSLGKVSETTSPSHRRNFSLSPPLPPPVIFHKVPKDVGERFDCTRSGRRTLQAPDAGPLSEPSPRITSPLALPRTRASNPNYRGAPRSLPVPFQDRRAPRPAARVPCLRCPTLSIPESLSGSEDPRAASLGADPVGTAEKCEPRPPGPPRRLPWALRSSRNWQSSSSSRQSPPGWCRERPMSGRARGEQRRGPGRAQRRAAEGAGSWRSPALAAGRRALQWTSGAGRSRA